MKKLLAMLLAAVLSLSTASVAFAEDKVLDASEDWKNLKTGEYTVSQAHTISEKVTVGKGQEVTIDFADKDVTFAGDGMLVVEGTLTLKGTEGGLARSDAATSTAPRLIDVKAGGKLVIDGGEYHHNTDNGITVYNQGYLIVNNGWITANYKQAIHTENAENATARCDINGGTIQGGYWGVGIFGDGQGNNDNSVLNINGGNISTKNDGQGVCTNASGGKYAGFTINITGGEINAECGMYLPGPGVTNISGNAVINGDLQGIRIAAGELNISGGEITSNGEANHEDSFIAGGSGGTNGVIAVGKAGDGYPGDIKINITGGKLVNSADGDAIVVSDANLGKNAYKDLKTEINVTHTDVTGNISVLTPSTPNDNNNGANISTMIGWGTTVNGEVKVDSKAASTALKGDAKIKKLTVAEDNKGNTTVEESVEVDITGDNITMVPPTEEPNRPEDRTDRSGGDYFGNEKWAKVKREIAAAEEGDTIEMSATGLPWFPSSAARALKGKDVTLEVRKNGVTYSINGLKIGSIDKIWYEFDQIETELLTAEAE